MLRNMRPLLFDFGWVFGVEVNAQGRDFFAASRTFKPRRWVCFALFDRCAIRLARLADTPLPDRA
jgi:hypothetical protein